MIQFKNVKKSFSGREVLKGISFTVNKGEILFILGTSGTGKSVLLKNLVGLLAPDSGEIWIDKEETSRFSESEFQRIRRKVGMVFQQPALFDSLSVFENIAFGLRRLEKLSEPEIVERVNKSLLAVHLPGISQKMPTELSYGMQKRVSLARTLALKPSFLLFDEPTTGLDPVSTTAVNLLIKDLSRAFQTTSIVVSHDMNCALSIADRILVLDQGLVVEQGTPEELKKSQVQLVKDFLQEMT